MAKLLVTGGAGFIGSNFVRMALRRGSEVRVLDKLTYSGNLENVTDLVEAGKIEFVRGDVCSSRTAKNAIRGCDAVVHFAAETHVDRSIEAAGTFVTTDVLGTFWMLEAARKENVDRFVHVSTDEVYGEAAGRPCREDSALAPKSPYAASKAGADRLAYSYFVTYALPVVITRCVNNYGPRQHPEKAIPLFTISALAEHPLPIYGTGENIREWIYVDDHCEALMNLLRAKGVDGETFNIGTGERKSAIDVARAVLTALGKGDDLIAFVGDRPGHVREHSVDSEKILRTLDWKPSSTFRGELPRVVAWYRRNVHWWRSLLLGRARTYFRRRYPELLSKVLKGTP